MNADPTAERVANTARAAARAGEPIARQTPLHDAVCQHVRARKADGAAPEAVIVEMKRLVGNSFAEPWPTASTPSVFHPDRDDMVREVVRWSIEAYFRGD